MSQKLKRSIYIFSAISCVFISQINTYANNPIPIPIRFSEANPPIKLTQQEGMVISPLASFNNYYRNYDRNLFSSQTKLNEVFELHLPYAKQQYQNHGLGLSSIFSETYGLKCRMDLSCWNEEFADVSHTPHALLSNGVYFLKSNQVIGYALLQRQEQGLIGTHPFTKFDRDALQQITALNIDKFIRFPSKNPPTEKDVTFYVRQAPNDFIERYGVLRYQDATYIVLDAYYPKHLDGWVQSRVRQQLPVLLENWFDP